MNEKQHEELAREFVEKHLLAPPTGVSMIDEIIMGNAMVQEAIQSSVDSIVKFMTWLTDSYEIVSKNHVRDLYCFYNDMLERGNLAIGYTDRYDAKKGLLEDLFPQTLKSEEE